MVVVDGLPLCACGCGGRVTGVHRDSNRKLGIARGQPRRFIVGHQRTRQGPDYFEVDCGYVTPCWLWLHGLSSTGYGMVRDRIKGVNISAHVLYYERKYGPVPKGKELDHKCRVHPCIRPTHLEAVTHMENMRRSPFHKLTWEEALALKHCGGIAEDVGPLFGVSGHTVRCIRAGEIWRDLP